MSNALVLPTHIKVLMGFAAAAVIALSAMLALTASAVEGAEITTTIHTSAHATTTEAAIGTMVHARAQVATSTGTSTPTGTVDFDVYANTSCSGTATSHNGVALVNGAAESSATAVTASGLSYRVSYNGDDNNVASEGDCVSLTALGEDAGISLSLSTTTALVGTAVHASATLNDVTSNASGTVAYTVYTNNSCTADAESAGTKSVSNGSVPNSDSITFDTADTYYWRAVYSGDTQNDAATSTCGSNALTILATSTPTGRIIVDKVTVPSNATTTFNFNAQGSGYNDFSLTEDSTPNEQVLVPGNYRISENSKSGWKLTSATCSYNGNTATTYNPGSIIDLDAGETVRCTFTNTQATSTPGNGGGDDDDDDDNDRECRQPFGIIKKVWAGISLPFGIEKKIQGGFSKWCDDDEDDNDNNRSSRIDDDHDDDNDRDRGRTERGKDKSNSGKNKNDD